VERRVTVHGGGEPDHAGEEELQERGRVEELPRRAVQDTYARARVQSRQSRQRRRGYMRGVS
jgi:hypothetical protein